MANDSFNPFVSSFVSFNINGLKENAENLNDYPILRRKVELYLFPSNHREWESFRCRFLQGERCLSPKVLCLVNLLARTIFENIRVPLFSIN